jgi:hypothetical protein
VPGSMAHVANEDSRQESVVRTGVIVVRSTGRHIHPCRSSLSVPCQRGIPVPEGGDQHNLAFSSSTWTATSTPRVRETETRSQSAGLQRIRRRRPCSVTLLGLTVRVRRLSTASSRWSFAAQRVTFPLARAGPTTPLRFGVCSRPSEDRSSDRGIVRGLILRPTASASAAPSQTSRSAMACPS